MVIFAKFFAGLFRWVYPKKPVRFFLGGIYPGFWTLHSALCMTWHHAHFVTSSAFVTVSSDQYVFSNNSIAYAQHHNSVSLTTAEMMLANFQLNSWNQCLMLKIGNFFCPQSLYIRTSTNCWMLQHFAQASAWISITFCPTPIKFGNIIELV